MASVIDTTIDKTVDERIEQTIDEKIDKTNIQGDIWPGLPKRFETFLFFRILRPDQFKSRLKAFVPKITTSAQAETWKDAKLEGETLEKIGVNIAFSSSGLDKLGKFTFEAAAVKKNKELLAIYNKSQLRGGLFEKGMYADLVGEGWDDPNEIRQEYKPTTKEERPTTHGVIMVTSKHEPQMTDMVESVKEHFLKESSSDPESNNPIIEFPYVRKGEALPGQKEHFGFKDGISQPQLDGLDETPRKNEPKAVKPGMIISGYDGDQMAQPDWAVGGSFLVFRDLQQLVPEFDKFLEDNAGLAPYATKSADPKEKLAAYLVGRWKNGTPVDLSPDDDKHDQPHFHNANNFNYHPIDKHERCPFGAHIRKMRPRGDLNDDHAVIIRRGISYGGEVTSEEKRLQKSDTNNERGLLFVCYQSDIRNGFNFLTTRWASNNHFPDSKTHAVGEHGPGLDAIVGQRLSHHPPRSLALPKGDNPTDTRIKLDKWVVQRGGEYFFSPSIKALRDYLTGDHEYPTLVKGH